MHVLLFTLFAPPKGLETSSAAEQVFAVYLTIFPTHCQVLRRETARRTRVGFTVWSRQWATIVQLLSEFVPHGTSKQGSKSVQTASLLGWLLGRVVTVRMLPPSMLEDERDGQRDYACQ